MTQFPRKLLLGLFHSGNTLLQSTVSNSVKGDLHAVLMRRRNKGIELVLPVNSDPTVVCSFIRFPHEGRPGAQGTVCKELYVSQFEKAAVAGSVSQREKLFQFFSVGSLGLFPDANRELSIPFQFITDGEKRFQRNKSQVIGLQGSDAQGSSFSGSVFEQNSYFFSSVPGHAGAHRSQRIFPQDSGKPSICPNVGAATGDTTFRSDAGELQGQRVGRSHMAADAL